MHSSENLVKFSTAIGSRRKVTEVRRFVWEIWFWFHKSISLTNNTKEIKVLIHFCKLVCQTSPKIIRIVNKVTGRLQKGRGTTDRLTGYLSLGKTSGKCEPGVRHTFDFCKTQHTYLQHGVLSWGRKRGRSCSWSMFCLNPKVRQTPSRQDNICVKG